MTAPLHAHVASPPHLPSQGEQAASAVCTVIRCGCLRSACAKCGRFECHAVIRNGGGLCIACEAAWLRSLPLSMRKALSYGA